MKKDRKRLDISFKNNKMAWIMGLVLAVSLIGHFSLGKEYNNLCRLVVQVEAQTGCPQGGRLWQEVVNLSKERLKSKSMPIEDVK